MKNILVGFLLLFVGCGNTSKATAQKASWQWQLQGEVNTSYDVDMYDIDLFDNNKTVIQLLQDDGKKVICYFSGGSYEEWRSDAINFPVDVLGNNLYDWEGEKWLDIRSDVVKNIMIKRLDLAVLKGCDGVEPDNMDGYTNNPGFDLTAQNQLDYNIFMANAAHERGLSIGLKNDLDQIAVLEPYYDFSVNEQCHEYDECDMMQPFINANKPVFNAEYAQKYVDNSDGSRDALCASSQTLKFQTLVLPLKLDDSFRLSCGD